MTTSAARWRIVVELQVFGFTGSPDLITKILTVPPTKTWRVGDPVPPSILRRKENCWIREAGAAPAAPLEEHLAALADLITSIAQNFTRLPKDAGVEVFCDVYDYVGEVTMLLPRRFIEAIASIHASLRVDYCDLREHG